MFEKIDEKIKAFNKLYDLQPNAIIMNDIDFIKFAAMIIDNKIDINGKLRYLGLEIIRTLNVKPGDIKVCFID